MSPRDRTIDLTKGIAIILVMLGHCIGFFQGSTDTPKDEMINAIINSFHMPLFFSLGGALHKERSIEDTLRSRFQSVVIPWIIYGGLNGIITLAIHGLNNIKLVGDENTKMLLGICKFQGGWFLVSYFLTCVLFCILENHFKDKKVPFGVTIVLMTALALATSAIDKNGMTSYIATAFIGLFFYYIGTLIKPFADMLAKTARVFSLSTGCLLLLLCGLSGMLLPNDIRMYSNSYENILLFLMNAILGCIGVLLIGKGIHHFAPLEEMGKLSLPIMAIQFPVYQALAYAIKKNEILQAFKVWPLCFVYYGATIVISTLLAYLVNKYFPMFSGKYKMS